MRKEKVIGWQKYEDFIEKQMSSPFLTNIIQNMAMMYNLDEEDEDEDEEDFEDMQNNKQLSNFGMMLPLTKQLIDDIAMLSNFDCWIGHTNFDLTPRVKDKLDKIPGIELLKICSRYRFFIGVGQMFDFTEVRNTIEEELIKGE